MYIFKNGLKPVPIDEMIGIITFKKSNLCLLGKDKCRWCLKIRINLRTFPANDHLLPVAAPHIAADFPGRLNHAVTGN